MTLGLFSFTIFHMRLLSQPCKEYPREIVIDGDIGHARKIREDETQYDILYFIECLGKGRGVRYSYSGAPPDDEYRNDPRPDRLIINEQSDDCIALEYAELHESEEYMKQLDYEIQKHGWWSSGPPPSPCELASILSQAIERKKNKRQFVNYPSLEKIILFRDRCSGNTKSFLECARYLVLSDDPGCDHCYVLLSSGVVLEVF